MKKSLVVIIVIAVVALLLFVWGNGRYNSMVTADEGVSTEWAKVESQYQRRTDLIPNLVSTVKGYAAHEEGTLTAVIEARAKATSITIDPSNLTEESLQQFQGAQDQISSALSRLMMVREQYPDLKANQQFMELQAQLEGTENRIAVARDRFNEAAKDYNVQIRKFPSNIIASLCGFDAKPYFKSQAGAETAPKVEF
ncbi:MAG: LemA family protein [Dysgonomonas sp.]